MTFSHAVATLLIEPYNQRLADLADMDDGQMASLLFPERDEDGKLVPAKREDASAEEEAPVLRTPREMFFWAGRRAGFEEETILARWKMRLEKHPDLDDDGMPRKSRG